METRLSAEWGGLFTSRPWIQPGPRIRCLDYKPQLQCTSVSGPEGAGPSPLSPPVIGAVPSLVTKPRDRGRLVFLRTVFHRRGNQGPERESLKITRGVSDGVRHRLLARGFYRGSRCSHPLPPFLAGTPGSWRPCCGNGLLWGWGRVGKKLAAGSARPGFSAQ